MHSVDDVRQVLERQCDLIQALRKVRKGWRSYEFWRWRSVTEFALRYVFGEESRQVREFAGIDWPARTSVDTEAESGLPRRFESALVDAEVLLGLCVREIGGRSGQRSS